MSRLARLLAACFIIPHAAAWAQEEKATKPLGSDAIVKQEFIYEEAPFPECHASTIAETAGGLVCAWFGGTKEGNRDVQIWFSRQEESGWTAPQQVADGSHTDGNKYPCWNPVLVAGDDDLTLFYKVGPSPSKWWGAKIISTDGGKTWGEPADLPTEYLGPVKNKPLRLADGRLVCGSSTEHNGWRLHFEQYDKAGRPIARVEPENNAESPQAIQPALLKLKDDTIVALCRPRAPGGLVETRSSDGSKSWSQGKRISLPNPGSGIDAVTLSDGRHLVVYNHTILGRSPLNVAIAANDMLTWQAAAVLENTPGEFSYPAVIQTRDDLVHVTYTHKRTKIRHVVLDPAKLKPASFDQGRWPE